MQPLSLWERVAEGRVRAWAQLLLRSMRILTDG